MPWLVCTLSLLLWVTPAIPRKETSCGNVFTEPRGVIQTPNFPETLPVPIHCVWTIDASKYPSNVTIVIYFTQFYLTDGVTIIETDDPSLAKLGRNLNPTTNSLWLGTQKPFFIIDLKIEKLEGNHLRFLDDQKNVYFMYGFNITYEIIGSNESPKNSCNPQVCSLLGDCLANDDLTEYECKCFHGFSGPYCSQGPMCQDEVCQNGGTCRHLSSVTVGCSCPPGFSGNNCEFATSIDCSGHGCPSKLCRVTEFSTSLCQCQHSQLIPTDRFRYGVTFRLANHSSQRNSNPYDVNFENHLTKSLVKYLKNADVAVVEQLTILNITMMGDVTFHFFGLESERGHIKGAVYKLMERGRLNNVSLDVFTTPTFRREPILNLTKIDVPKSTVRVDEEFSVSCIAQGSVFMEFTWFKDGTYINESMSHRSLSLHLFNLSSDSYQYTLLIGKANVLDHGTYTCRVKDWGMEQCSSVHIHVLPRSDLIRIIPMTATVVQGDKIDLRCIPDNIVSLVRLGYTWARNKQRFEEISGKIVTEDLYLNDFFNDLYNGGNVLELTNVTKSATYSCQMQGGGKLFRTKDVFVDVVANKSLKTLCQAEGAYGVAWPLTSANREALIECPDRAEGVAKRPCLTTANATTMWHLPDFSDCSYRDLKPIVDNLTRLTLGYDVTNTTEVLHKLLKALKKRPVFRPGEGGRILDILDLVLRHFNRSNYMATFVAESVSPFYQIIDYVLSYEKSLLHEHQIHLLQRLVRKHGLMWAATLNGTTSKILSVWGKSAITAPTILEPISAFDTSNWNGAQHRPQATTSKRFRGWMKGTDNVTNIFVEAVSLKPSDFTLKFPPNLVPILWFNGTMEAFVKAGRIAPPNSSVMVVVTAYRNLSEYLPQRYENKYKNDSDVIYELNSQIVAVDLGVDRHSLRPPADALTVDLQLAPLVRDFDAQLWTEQCAVADVASYHGTWDLQACVTHVLAGNATRCTCRRPGAYALVLVLRPKLNLNSSGSTVHTPVVVGCICCLVQTLLALAVLLPHWWRHRTCIVFLKIQCCLSVSGAMSVFIYSVQFTVPEEMYSVVTSFLEIFLLLPLTVHLSILLVVNSEILHIHHVHRIKQSIVCITTGAPLLAVLTNVLSHRSTGWPPTSWCLVPGSMTFTVFITTAIVTCGLFAFLYVNVLKKLLVLFLGNSEKNRAVVKRLGLLKRSALIFVMLIVMEVASILYTGMWDISNQYFFGSSSALLGSVILLCYTVKSESPPYLRLLNKLKLDATTPDDFSSDSAISPLSFFTKQDGEQESEGAAPRRGSVARVRSKDHRADPAAGEQLLLQEPARPSKGKAGIEESSTLETCMYSEGSLNAAENTPLSPSRYKPMSSFRVQEGLGFGEYVEQDLKGPTVKPLPAHSYILDPSSTKAAAARDMKAQHPEVHSSCREQGFQLDSKTNLPTEMITTRVCVELGVITTHQRNEVTGLDEKAPALVLCSVDVEPCQSRVISAHQVEGESCQSLTIGTQLAHGDPCQILAIGTHSDPCQSLNHDPMIVCSVDVDQNRLVSTQLDGIRNTHEAPAIVICSLDVDQCASRITSPLAIKNGNGKGLLDGSDTRVTIEEQEETKKIWREPVLQHDAKDLPRSETNGISPKNLPSISEEPKSDLPSRTKTPDNMDVLDRISHDLDYLLNRKSSPKVDLVLERAGNLKKTIMEENEDDDAYAGPAEYLANC